ncbi:hypothetical protein M413DRAFT_30149 [Hebeloma cylindrosporum]|uniref:Uncharacterized protein n=1 Tax=Hebeloma cylindrosporum TaxID=76867 RepID=A0A0C3C1Y9_HEBCY|nr:hypothetical protein M413DRAFT_30149 [Hebeloma cylindrosporum h7]
MPHPPNSLASFSKSKHYIKSLRHTCKCINAAIARLPIGVEDLTWVVILQGVATIRMDTSNPLITQFMDSREMALHTE